MGVAYMPVKRLLIRQKLPAISWTLRAGEAQAAMRAL
jgi:hypothetical protein